jgi:hypothetical protein
MLGSSDSSDLDRLYVIAKFCYAVTLPQLEGLPLTRESQSILVKFLTQKLSESDIDFAISRDFVAETVGCRDENLVGNWSGSASDIAWLMLHEALSNFFVKFAMMKWYLNPYIIHHVPKSAGTSVSTAVYAQSYFVSYPQASFRVMAESRGLLGFSKQVAEFERSSGRRDRIYIGGHFNLPDMVASLGNFGRCRGVTLTRSPVSLMSSALRYVWTRVEEGDNIWTNALPGLVPEHLAAVRKTLSNPDDLMAPARLKPIIVAIMDSPLFRENYDEIFIKYFYNADVNDLVALTRFLRDCGDIFPCVDISRDKDIMFSKLNIKAALPRENTSLLGHGDLVRAFGGEVAFRAALAPRLLASSEIYGVLCALRSQYP